MPWVPGQLAAPPPDSSQSALACTQFKHFPGFSHHFPPYLKNLQQLRDCRHSPEANAAALSTTRRDADASDDARMPWVPDSSQSALADCRRSPARRSRRSAGDNRLFQPRDDCELWWAVVGHAIHHTDDRQARPATPCLRHVSRRLETVD